MRACLNSSSATRCPFSDPQDPVSRVSRIKGQGPTQIRPFLRTPNKGGYAVFNTGLKQRVEDRTELGPGA
ncbi:hypothetical protein EHS43_12275 [Streptomyces sp. RP5T]|nr:hypothetical protein EHS43_12275 [Streptomyces sp. RP5T]